MLTNFPKFWGSTDEEAKTGNLGKEWSQFREIPLRKINTWACSFAGMQAKGETLSTETPGVASGGRRESLEVVQGHDFLLMADFLANLKQWRL